MGLRWDDQVVKLLVLRETASLRWSGTYATAVLFNGKNELTHTRTRVRIPDPSYIMTTEWICLLLMGSLGNSAKILLRRGIRPAILSHHHVPAWRVFARKVYLLTS